MNTITIRTDYGPREIEALAQSGDFAVTYRATLAGLANGYTITHVPSGYRMPLGNRLEFDALEDAVALMEEFDEFLDSQSIRQGETGEWFGTGEGVKTVKAILINAGLLLSLDA